jgi:signal transduction histidine kinase
MGTEPKPSDQKKAFAETGRLKAQAATFASLPSSAPQGADMDPLTHHRSRLIRDSLYLFLAGTTISLLFFLRSPLPTLLLLAGTMPFYLLFGTSLFLIRKNKPKASALLVVIGVTLLQIPANLFAPSQSPEALVSLLNLILFAGFTLGPVAALLESLVAVLGVASFLYIQEQSWLPTPLAESMPELSLAALSPITLSATVLTTGGLVALSVHHLFLAQQRAAKISQELSEIRKMDAIGRLSAGLAHDFNNLLAAILGSAELGMVHLRKGESTEEALKSIEVASRRGAALTQKLLAFAQSTTLSLETFDLAHQIRALTPALRGIGNTLRLEVQLPEEPLWICSRPVDVEQVLFNLVSNAKAASPLGGNVELSLARAQAPAGMNEKNGIRIRVQDHGCGMNEETLSRLFEPFFTTRSDLGGHGLGLAVSYGLIQSAGGMIEVSSKPNEGSCFDVWIPEATPETIPKPVPHSAVAATGLDDTSEAADSAHVLVVEDNKEVRQVLTS